jgi:hypothetical protein
MKRILSFLLVLGFASATTHAQLTMPAMGANTLKSKVAKTDQTTGIDKSNASIKGTSKRTNKGKALTAPQ